MNVLLIVLGIAALFCGAALLAHRTPGDARPQIYTCRSGARVDAEPWGDRTLYGVEGDLELDDGRPTDPGEEITEVSRYDWSDESGSMPSAAEELERKR